ncbi:MAG: lysylphosphatidylglycerol synthase transmembrane domain-containing protein [Candidatus ainarchaeum sp.]|nr:lysylphosphatidylglycerol synthase transmembrane domain-containing protein [Candidatus ainarchaeum sp.]
MKNFKEYAINLVITFILFLVILYFIDIEKVINVVLNSNYYFLGMAVFAYIVVITIMSLRIRIVLNELKHFIPFRSILNSNLAGMLASDFTPARSGYFFTAFSLSSKHKIPISESILTILGPQLFDFMIKVVSLSVIAIVLIDRIDGLQENIFAIIFAIVCIFSVILFFGGLIFINGFIKKFKFIEKFPLIDRIYLLFERMQKKSHKLIKIKYKIVGITFLSWGVKALEWFFISKALGIVLFDGGILDYLFMLVLQGSVTLIQFMPLPTIAGGGASELGASGILLLFGVPIETGIAFALLTRGIMILVDSLGSFEIVNFIRKRGIGKIFNSINSIKHEGEKN